MEKKSSVDEMHPEIDIDKILLKVNFALLLTFKIISLISFLFLLESSRAT